LVEDEDLRTKIVDQTESIVVTRAIYVIIGIVAFLLFVSSLGCSGAASESRCLLTHYAMILIVILVLEIAAGCLATGYAYNAEKEIKAVMVSSIRHFNVSADHKEDMNDATLIWNSIFENFNCCGVYTYNDLRNSTANGSMLIPETCCAERFVKKNGKIDCIRNSEGFPEPHKHGCYNAVFNVMVKIINIVMGIIFGLVSGQCFSIVLARFLAETILKRNLNSPERIRWLLREQIGP
jgi:hypothetical protein